MANASPSAETALDQFVDRLMAEKGFQNIPPEVLEQMKKDLRNRAEDRINAALVAKLPPDQLAAFETTLDHGNQAAIQTFLSKHIPNMEEVIAAELLSFRETYLNP